MNLNSIALALHVLSAVLWVGGMFFAYQVLRPVAAEQLEPPARLRLWAAAFSRFFPWVWLFVVLLPVSGYWLMFKVYGGMSAGVYIHLMQSLGWIMILLYMHLFFAPFRRLKEAVVTEQWPMAGKQLNQIRRIVGINLGIGLVVVAIASAGRFFQA
ncbi:MAG: CopD family protein [bacterium]